VGGLVKEADDDPSGPPGADRPVGGGDRGEAGESDGRADPHAAEC
jgi:hypothetical protein